MSRTQVDACQRGPEIRQACYSDHPAIRDFLGGLSLRARYLRFFTGAVSASPAMLRVLAGGGDHIDVVVAVEDDVIIGHAMASDVAGPGGVPVTEIGVVVTDARQDNRTGPSKISGLAGTPRGRAELFERPFHRRHIACAVINHRDAHSSPLVLGRTPLSCRSRLTANRRARAKALNSAST